MTRLPWLPIVAVGLIVLAALAVTGALAARAGRADPLRASLRVLVGGTLGLAFTYGMGRVVGVAL